MEAVIREMINTNEKANESWVLVPAVLSGPGKWVCLSNSTENCWRAPRRGWWKPLTCVLRHIAPSQKGESGHMLRAYIFFRCIFCVKGRNVDTMLLSLWVFLKIGWNIPLSKNNFLWGQWNLFTQIFIFALFLNLLLLPHFILTQPLSSFWPGCWFKY